ncbi:hypothetical protein SBA5_670025 [Candidatus Sulfotelmatomonas gaucii]|uniref:Uncharacterized protein n=1 Tax=Candidatus Sulfuritelmatomonas gaucii TaxID=2043161 RepID=A0A2N9LZE6_9BACT|nr:hypothetical protein SBA5_670025 [Candidatus Sulfotelmatomonas gaucii]
MRLSPSKTFGLHGNPVGPGIDLREEKTPFGIASRSSCRSCAYLRSFHCGIGNNCPCRIVDASSECTARATLRP